MSARLPLLPLASLALLAVGFTGGSCGGLEPTEPLPFSCGQFDEAACSVQPACTPTYRELCTCGAEVPTDAARPCEGGECDPVPEPCTCAQEYAGCIDRSPCQGLSEQNCVAQPSCEAVYGDSLCVCPGGDGNGFRAPPPDCEGDCYPPEPPPCDCQPPAYLECRERPTDPCEGLNEQACVNTPGCYPEYGFSGADRLYAPCEESDPTCTMPVPPPPHDYLGCRSGEICPPVCAIYCEFGNVLDPNGCATCECNPPPHSCYGLDEQSCIASNCEARYENSCDDDGSGFRPCEPSSIFVGCFPPNGCQTDADCPNGYCEHFATCTAIGCPEPPPSQCVFPNCDDGQEVLCDAVQPTCGPGEIAAARNGCWQCVDARSCEQAPPPVCGDGIVLCDALPPECPAGTILGAGNGCWSCYEPTTCQEVACHDGSEIVCRALPPQCAPGESLAVLNACWDCVNPLTCQ